MEVRQNNSIQTNLCTDAFQPAFIQFPSALSTSAERDAIVPTAARANDDQHELMPKAEPKSEAKYPPGDPYVSAPQSFAAGVPGPWMPMPSFAPMVGHLPATVLYPGTSRASFRALVLSLQPFLGWADPKPQMPPQYIPHLKYQDQVTQAWIVRLLLLRSQFSGGNVIYSFGDYSYY